MKIGKVEVVAGPNFEFWVVLAMGYLSGGWQGLAVILAIVASTALLAGALLWRRRKA